VRKFIARHSDKITGVLSGFDRMIFRGHLLPLCHDGGVRRFLAGQEVLLKDFESFVKCATAMIREAATDVVDARGRPSHYLESSRVSKEDFARRVLVDSPVRSGPICLLSTLEPCSSWRVWRSRERLHPQELRRHTTKCLHLYTYFVDPEFGFCHVRVQTWMPFTVQVYVNGREWLGRQLDRARMSYRRADNCFPWLADPQRAQAIFDGMLDLPWRQLLDGIVDRANPALAAIINDLGAGFYWTLHQSEWATDVMFRDAAELARLYPDLVRHAMTDFSSEDVMRFLGRRLTPAFNGEVVTDLRRRYEGVRIKHFVDLNSQKLYDRAHAVAPVRGLMPAALRAEGTINDPRVYKVRRKAQGDPDSERKPRPLRKGIVDLRRRARVCQQNNERYLDALAVVGSPAKVHDVIAPVIKPADLNGRRVRALHPWAEPDLPLLKAIGHGNHLVNGFRNRDILAAVIHRKADDDHERRRQSARVSYLLRILRGHGLIQKVEGTHRYHVTDKGRELIAAVIATDQASLTELKHCA